MWKKRILITLTVLLISVSSIVTLSNSYSISKAGPACGSMGSFMTPTRVSSVGIINSGEPNRKWTVEEVFGSSIFFTSYYGEGEGDWIYVDKVDRGKSRARIKGYDWSDAEVQDNLKSARGLSCMLGKGDFLPNITLGLASMIASLISIFITFLLGEDFMVSGLIDIIGGTDGTNGLISIFFQSIYMPLVVIAFLFTAGSIIYKGLIKRQLREALSSIVWSVMAFVVGVTLMFVPGFLVGVPQAVTSTITTCVLGALNGENCLTGDVTAPSLLTGIECSSRVEGVSGADMMVNGMSCTIWKTFVLEPWAEEQFGIPYNQLYTQDPPEGGRIWNGLADSGMDGKDYCVNLGSSGSAEDFDFDTVLMDRKDNSTVCNVALYQLYLMTDIKDTVNHDGDFYRPTSDNYDERWYDIIVPLAKHNTGWNNWAGKNRLILRLGSTLMSIIGIVAASTVLIVLAVFAAAYKITGVIMMAFAPLFLLFAIEPNRGKKIFLGWLETLISSLLKYFAITVLIIVSLVLYAGVLSTTSNVTSLIAVVVLTVVLLSYRSEVVNLIGASNMGGQKLTNKANKAMDWTGKQVKQKGSAVVGGAVGGAIAGRGSYLKDIEERKANIKNMQDSLKLATAENRTEDMKIMEDAIREETRIKEEMESGSAKRDSIRTGMKEGSKGATQRIMRRGTSLTATAFRQKNMTGNALDKAYSDRRGMDIHNEAQVTDAMMGKDRSKSNSKFNQENNFNVSDLDLDKTTLASQRDTLSYKGDLTQEEKAALDKFADDLASQDDDRKLASLVNNPKIANDVNKKMVVANEINARLRFNTLKGNFTNPDLITSPVASPANMSNLDLRMGINIAEENYKRTGNLSELNRINELGSEEVNRGIKDKELFENDKQEIKSYRETLEKEGISFKKDDSIKSKDELSEMYSNDKKGYDNYIESNYSEVSKKLGSDNMSISQDLINREKQVSSAKGSGSKGSVNTEQPGDKNTPRETANNEKKTSSAKDSENKGYVNTKQSKDEDTFEEVISNDRRASDFTGTGKPVENIKTEQPNAEDINPEDIDNTSLNDEGSKGNEIDDFYDNLDDFIK